MAKSLSSRYDDEMKYRRKLLIRDNHALCFCVSGAGK